MLFLILSLVGWVILTKLSLGSSISSKQNENNNWFYALLRSLDRKALKMNVVIVSDTVLPLPWLFKIRPKSRAQKSYLTATCKSRSKTEVNTLSVKKLQDFQMSIFSHHNISGLVLKSS